MELREMNTDELLLRKSAITEEVESEGADLDALELEVKGINEELEARKAEEAKRAEIRAAVAEGAGETIETFEKLEERKTMSDIEIRNSAEYIDAFAEYIKNGDPTECRNMLTTENDTTPNGTATVAVPELVYDVVRTAWSKEGIMSRVRKAYLRGNLKVGFEISGSDATVHAEGASAISTEDLVLGVANLVPEYIKKVVQLSKEVYSLRGEAFIRYIYDELTYRIAKKAADELVAKIVACGTVSTTTCPGVPKIAVTSPDMGTIATAIANLSDEAANPVIMMNKLSYAKFKEIQYGANYAADPFEGLPVVFNSTIKAFSAASTGDTYVIVGDLDQGALANFPNGEGIEFTFDNLTLKKQNLIEIMGEQYIGLGVVAPNAFVKITK
jgi:HK97 family phage major capsid protein